MVIFYRGPYVQITHEVFERLHPTRRVFHLHELQHLRVVERAADPAAVTSIRTGSTAMAGAAAVVVGLGYTLDTPLADSPLLTIGVLAVLLASATLSACWRYRRIQQEILAVYQGRLVSLFRSTDSQMFGQVKRGLVRALEWQRDTP